MRFFLVHELSGATGGRMRVRASRPFSEIEAQNIRQELEAAGLDVRSVSLRVGSLLLFYTDMQQREAALRCLASRSEEETCRSASVRALPSGRGEGSLCPEEDPAPGGFGPLLRFFFVRPFLPMVLRTVSCVIQALPYLRKGLAALRQGRCNVDVLDAAAIGVSLLRRDFRTVTVLTLLLGLGETLEYWTRRRSLDSLAESLALNVDSVWRLEDGVERAVPLSDIAEGDCVVVRDGGSIPVDGVVVEGVAVVNEASMTGEPLGTPRSVGASVYSGTVVEQGRLVIRAVHVGDGTRLRQVVRFIEASEALKASVQGRYERLADMAVPFTFALAGLVWLLTRDMRRAASVLLVDYSCALRLATPLAVLSAMRVTGWSSRGAAIWKHWPRRIPWSLTRPARSPMPRPVWPRSLPRPVMSVTRCCVWQPAWKSTFRILWPAPWCAARRKRTCATKRNTRRWNTWWPTAWPRPCTARRCAWAAATISNMTRA